MSLTISFAAEANPKPLLLCMSHLRWESVVQRPHHLMRHASAAYRVVFWEEAEYAPPGPGLPRLRTRLSPDGILVATLLVAYDTDALTVERLQRERLATLVASLGGTVDVAWLYTPMMLPVMADLVPGLTVYDCMDELSAFHGASPQLVLLERRLLRRSDLVFTGGRSLFAAKQPLHGQVHLFPSSVDAGHFGQARARTERPADQAGIPAPRIGFHGVIDERMDLALLAGIADARPDWHLVMVGPIVKIDPASVPQRANIHWLGARQYDELPDYLAGWRAGFMPFAQNEATRFISPTKTPEFLAAGLPVVSTPVADVVHDYGQDGLVEIADGVPATVAALARVLDRPAAPWLAAVDRRLQRTSWAATWARMQGLIDASGRQGAGTVPTTARERH